MEEYYDREIIPPLKKKIENLIEIIRKGYKEKTITDECLSVAVQSGMITMYEYLKIIE